MINIILLLIFLISLLIYFISNKKVYEGYWDYIPYGYHYNIYKCYDTNCIKKQVDRCSNACYNINTISEQALASGVGKCKDRCKRAGEEQILQLGFSKYNWYYALPDLKKYSLFNE